MKGADDEYHKSILFRRDNNMHNNQHNYSVEKVKEQTMRPIDADKLIPMMKYATTDSEIGVFPIKIGFNDIEKVINEQPTVNTAEMIESLPPAQPEQRWIPFKTRPLTKEEKEEHPEWDGILDCKLPDDGQRILVNVSVGGHESVQYDEFYTDDGSYLDSGYEIGTEATAWMPLPEKDTQESEKSDI